MAMGACPGQIPMPCVPPTLMATATMVRACRYITCQFSLGNGYKPKLQHFSVSAFQGKELTKQWLFLRPASRRISRSTF